MEDKHLLWSDRSDRKVLIEALGQGQVAISTTDTVLGFLASVTPEAYNRLNVIKGREHKPYLVLVRDSSVLDGIMVPLSENMQKLLNECWPGPVTFIVPINPKHYLFSQSYGGTLGVRVPDHVGLRQVLANIPLLFSTSANKAGVPVVGDWRDLDPELVAQVSYIITDDAAKNVVPSTIIDLTKDRPSVVRLGAYPLSKLESIYGQTFLNS